MSWPLRALVALLGALLVLFALRPASAAPAKVLVVGEPSEPLVSRLRDELRALGLRVELSDADDDPQKLLPSRDADALVAARSSPPRLRLWLRRGDVVDAIGDLGAESPGEPGLRVLVLRAVEILRAQLIPVEVRPPSPEPPATPAETAPPLKAPAQPTSETELRSPVELVPPPSDPDSLRPENGPESGSTPPAPGVSFSLGAGALVAPGGTPPAAQLRLGASWPLLERLAIEAQAIVPTAGGGVSVPEGELEVRVLAAAVGPSLWLSDPRADLAAAAHLGVGGGGLFHSASASAPNQATSGSSGLLAGYLGVAARYRIAPWFAARADADAWLLAPRHELRTLGRASASVGPLAAVLSLGAELTP